ncbi:DUF523 domain-containing protein [Paenibacillus sp. MZ04-78.2]|uniref:DUF523 domain-containing protein n=1 Tax=Paenibacillus sp. MZ04-78.2 TaxID=2962034 RepID=UPI0020B897F2|nr:DUF523 domain-containing protein [Paenibacillus sp. MZ04-78.2]MCP3776659.1 DUF523 domain-containing protein [Paenibacillus sp. MZ04-78.2]
MILVSSCLAGLEVRYNGTHCLDKKIRELLEDNQAITVCPELLGGFSTPREPAEIVGGSGEDVLDGKAKVVEKSGRDVTELYVKGAYATLRKAKEVEATVVILKEFSPSCGSSMIYNGEFKGKKMVGNGVTTALLKRNGIQVVSEERLSDFLMGIFRKANEER